MLFETTRSGAMQYTSAAYFWSDDVISPRRAPYAGKEQLATALAALQKEVVAMREAAAAERNQHAAEIAALHQDMERLASSHQAASLEAKRWRKRAVEDRMEAEKLRSQLNAERCRANVLESELSTATAGGKRFGYAFGRDLRCTECGRGPEAEVPGSRSEPAFGKESRSKRASSFPRDSYASADPTGRSSRRKPSQYEGMGFRAPQSARNASRCDLDDALVQQLIEMEIESLAGTVGEERGWQRRRLQMKWHPDKNSHAAEFATKVFQGMQEHRDW